MLKERTFQVVLVSEAKPVGYSPDARTDLVIAYSGKQVTATPLGR